MKFLFIYPTSGTWTLAAKKAISVGANLPPLGILYIARMLEINGHNVEVIDFNAENISEDKLKEKILSSDAIGMTIYSDPIPLNNSILLSKFIKNCDPEIPLIIGGPNCTLYPEKALIDLNADISVMGEGELIINPVAEALEGKRKLSTINGICYKENNEIKKNKPAEQIKNLDEIPFPARHLVEKYEYGGYMLGVKIAKGKLTSFLASRGCPFRCRFCGMCYLLPKHTSRSINNITEEIDEVIDTGYKTISFVDDNFLQKKDAAEKIMDHIIKKNIDVRLWIEEARVDSADRKLYQKMRDAGVEKINFGIENGNQDVLDYYNKKITLDQARKAVKLSKEMGFFVNASFILGAPIETKNHIENTIKFAKSLPLDSVNFYTLEYGYGTKIWDEAVADGKIKPYEHYVPADSKRGLGNFTEEELNELSMKAYRSYYFNPRLWAREIFHAFYKRDFRYVKMGLKMLTSS
jgi:radical SAM superfamily enzyme YgiQ (UPF0313 family)